MKYENGNIVALYDGRTVYIITKDEKNKIYHVSDAESEECFAVSEKEIAMLVM